MEADDPLAILRNRWLRMAAGLVAMAAASALAFHAGHDAAQALLGTTSPAPAAPLAAHPVAPPAHESPAPASTPVNDPFVVKSILDIDGPIRFGDYYWDESKAERGPLVITVDLAARTLSVFRNGHEIGATAILKGYGSKPTPTGVFPITQKDADHVSTIYEAPMPYMLRLTPDGVSIHGAKVEKGYATNGCVGVPEEFAAKLFRRARLGDKVVITDGKRMGLGDAILTPAAPAS